MSVRFSSAGGYTTAQDWLTLATLARDCGDGNVYLSAMSTIELRNVSDVAEVHQKLETTGLRTNKCQVLAHPLSLPARTFAANLAVELPAEISASHVINVVDIAHPRPSHNATVEVVLLDAGEQASEVRIHVQSNEITTSLSDAPAYIANLLLSDLEQRSVSNPQQQDQAGHEVASGTLNYKDAPIGWLTEHVPDGRVELGAGLHNGVLPAEHAELLGRIDVPITVTPWGGLVIHDLAEGDADVVLRVLAPRGFIFDVHSPLLRH